MTNIRAKFTKGEDIKYISHLDLMRLFERAFRRANLPLKYSEGFNPHPKFSFATALSLGTSSDGEYMDIEFNQEISIEDFTKRINEVLPEGIKIIKAAFLDEKDSIMSLIRWSNYAVKFSINNKIDIERLNEEINKFMGLEEIIITKEKKKGRQIVKKQESIRDRIKDITVLQFDGDMVLLKVTLMTGSNGNLKPEKLVEVLDEYTEIDIFKESVRIHRLELFIEKDNNITTPI